NLQTVASLLRLQARGDAVDPRRALDDSVNRILAIAAVHEVLTERRDESVVFSELLQNALEHGGDSVRIELAQRDGEVLLAIADDGNGIIGAPAGTGLSIVEALVRDEIGGTLSLADDGGLRAEVAFPA